MSEIEKIKKAIIQASKNYDEKVLRRKRQKRLNDAYTEQYFASIEYQQPTSEIYFNGDERY
tara:strand:- start:178 stop:360 length:183 start_codon:yes stop_codon:yes gene_type:complete